MPAARQGERVHVVGGAYGDGVRAVAGGADRLAIGTFVAGRGQNHQASVVSGFDGLVDGVVFPVLGGGAAQRHVDDADAQLVLVFNAPLDALDDVGVASAAGARENLDADDVGFAGHALVDAFAHGAVAGGAAGNVGAVAVVVISHR